MEFTAQQIAQFVQGRIEGDENATNTFSKIEEGKPGPSLSFPIPNIHIIYITHSRL